MSLWPGLSAILGVDIKQMMEGEITPNKVDSGNISRVRFYVCPTCGNILFSTGSASIFCCGRKLEALVPTEHTDLIKMTVEEMDTDMIRPSGLIIAGEINIIVIIWKNREYERTCIQWQKKKKQSEVQIGLEM